MKVSILFETNEQIKVYFEDADLYLQQLLKESKKSISDCGTYKQNRQIIAYDLTVNIKHSAFIHNMLKDYNKELKLMSKEQSKAEKNKQRAIKKEKEKTKKIIEKSLTNTKRKRKTSGKI